MADEQWLTERFEADRPRLEGVAYRMLGSHDEAEDAVQETWLRLHRTDADAIENLGGWLTTVTSRVCLDRLRARGARREELTGDDLTSEPVDGDDRGDPAGRAVVADSVTAALVVVLDALGPDERVAFVLHDVFAVPFEQIAPVVDRSIDATRQLASRARRRVRGSSSTSDLDLARQHEVVHAFLRAAQGGDIEGLVRVLHPDVELRPDEAARQLGALHPARGAQAVAEALSGGAQAARVALVDGLAGLVWAPGGRLRGVVAFTLVDGRIVDIDVTADPERLAALDLVPLD